MHIVFRLVSKYKKLLFTILGLFCFCWLGDQAINYSNGNIDLQKGINAYEQKHYTEAMPWLKKSAGHGNATAMYFIGVAKNLDTAITWWKKAAALGNKNAINALKKHEK